MRNVNRVSKISKKNIRLIAFIIMAVILFITAIFVMWWYGLFIYRWVDFKEYERSPYYGTELQLKDRRLSIYEEDTLLWETDRDWFVQDMLISDINKDGIDEIVLLVWKHGSFGKHKPIWVKRNDIKLEQHIFIYQHAGDRDQTIRPVWMSSSIGYEIESIARLVDALIVTDRAGNCRVWYWEDFGLKLVGDSKAESIEYVAAGDNLIHMWLYKYGSFEGGNDFVNRSFDRYYAHVKDIISKADIASVNQETPLVSENFLLGDYPRFGTPGSIAQSLSCCGFDIVSCATNHMLDRGYEGVVSTERLIREQGMIPVGINVGGISKEKIADDSKGVYEDSLQKDESDIYVEFVIKNRIKLGVLSYTYGTNGIQAPEQNPYAVECFENEERLIQQIRYAKLRSDAVILYAHWGTEYSRDIDEKQEKLVSLLLREGVDVVIGTHPHVLQPMEIYCREDGHTMTVYYSLGNFVSGQKKEDTLVGGLANFIIYKEADGTVHIGQQKVEKIKMKHDKDECAVYLYE